ncbi:PAS domain S-box protein [Bowmanella dokdonensis]|uniref:histidine kinase n=1 Tax=Bowmanella dokdonensis TaxID=751969 RepID=A0A939DNB8_9ALTE|nr:PAS domain S-box protein [Bowmanella dokdonensis]MBN7825949.1 PAS domain S-box protein [Bowmanella dokdonensis]
MFSRRYLRVTLLVAALAAIMVLLFVSGIRYERQKTFSTLTVNLTDQLKARTGRLEEQVAAMKRDVMLLSGVPPIQGLVRVAAGNGLDAQENSTAELWITRLEEIFTAYLNSHPDIKQVRYIGLENDGAELVRVDRNQGQVRRVPPANLQHKAHRDYFIETIELPEGQLYVSEINLNRELGEIETPLQPTIRVATPIYDKGGTLFGLVIVNWDLTGLLQDLATNLNTDRQLYLLNSEGQYLIHPDAQRSFSFEFGAAATWQDEFEVLPARYDWQQTLRRVSNGQEVFYLAEHELTLQSGHTPRHLTMRITYPQSLMDRDVASAAGRQVAAMFGGMLLIGTLLLLYRMNVRQRQRLSREQARLAAIVTHSRDAVIGADLKGMITDWNLTAERIFGYSYEEAVGQSFVQLLVPEHLRQETQHTLQKIRQGQLVLPYDTQRRCKDGSLAMLSVSVSPVTEGEKIIGAAATMRDISQQKAYEMQIQQLNNELENRVAAQTAEIAKMHRFQQAVLKQAGHAVIATDPNGLITLFNPAAEKLLGYGADEMIGKQSPAVFHLSGEIESRAKSFSKELGRNVLPGFEVFVCKSRLGKVNSHEWTYVHKSGRYIDVQLSVTSLVDEQGEITGFLGMATDISEQVQVRRELVSTRDHLLKAAEVGELGIWSWEVKADKLSWNERMFQIYQLPAATRLNYQSWYDSVHPEDRKWLISQLQDLLAGKGVFSPTFRIRLPDSSVRTIQAAATVECDSNGEPELVLGINRDITAQRQYEHTLQKARIEADSANKAKSAFLANMSHEIRTPMNAVLGMLQLLKRGELKTQQQDYVTKAESAGNTLLSILNDILDFSKVEAGKLHLDPQPCDLDLVLREVANIVSASVDLKDLDVLFDLDPQLPSEVLLDGMRLKQILINLAGNAIKFTEEGEVCLSVRKMQQVGDSLTLEFHISDTGIGIDEGQLQHIFDGFSQAEASTTRRFGGSGLGLAICKRLVDLMGGELKVVSELGKGSTFSFTLPCEVLQKRRTRNLPKDLRVLIVDDHEATRDVLLTMIQSFGWQGEAIDKGERAIAKMALGGNHPPYDLVLMDWKMPGMDGWEVCECIRAMFPPHKLPMFIMVTAHGAEIISQRQSIEEITNALLVKPITASMLLDTVADCLNFRGRLTAAKEVGKKPLKGLRLLLVEDNKTNQQVAMELLTIEGAEVLLAENGMAAVERVRRERQQLDLVLMDVQMPGMDGYTATKQIRQKLGLRTLPIIAMTANALASDRETALAVGMNDHLGKPFELENLLRVILKWTHGPGDARTPAETGQEGAASEQASTVSQRIDWQGALKRMGRNRAVLEKSIRSFLAEAPEILDSIPANYPLERRAHIADQLHSLKGMGATIGATVVAQLAGQLERQLRQNNPREYGVNRTGLARQLELCRNELEILVGKNSGEIADKSISKVWLLSELNRLLELLEQANLDALVVFENLKDSLLRETPILSGELNQSMESMDFPRALALCKQVKSRIEEQ